MTYEEIVKNKDLAEKITGDCYFKASDPVKKWEDARKFIAKAINKSGTILDIGCANGFLLKSLQSWTKLNLIPFGVDNLEKNIKNALGLFPDYPLNFVHQAFEEFLSSYPKAFPEKFDFIYWCYWNNAGLIKKEEIDYLLQHIKEGGRLIIGFYPEDSSDPTDTIGNIPSVSKMGYQTTIVKNTVPNRSEQLIFIER